MFLIGRYKPVSGQPVGRPGADQSQSDSLKWLIHASDWLNTKFGGKNAIFCVVLALVSLRIWLWFHCGSGSGFSADLTAVVSLWFWLWFLRGSGSSLSAVLAVVSV